MVARGGASPWHISKARAAIRLRGARESRARSKWLLAWENGPPDKLHDSSTGKSPLSVITGRCWSSSDWGKIYLKRRPSPSSSQKESTLPASGVLGQPCYTTCSVMPTTDRGAISPSADRRYGVYNAGFHNETPGTGISRVYHQIIILSHNSTHLFQHTHARTHIHPSFPPKRLPCPLSSPPL